MANDKGGRFGFRFADLGRRLFAAIATVQKLVRLCCAQHKRTYVAMEIMWRSAHWALKREIPPFPADVIRSRRA